MSSLARLAESPWGAVQVDAGMVTILKALWAKNIRTCMSCEHNNGNVWIHFELEPFKRLVQKSRRSSDLRGFICYCCKEFHWHDDDDEWCHEGANDSYEVALRFPCRYKEAFEAFLAAW